MPAPSLFVYSPDPRDFTLEAAVNRFAFAVLNWKSTPPKLPGVYAWRCGTEGPEFVEVGSDQRQDGSFGPLLVVEFAGKSMPLIEVLGTYPASEWAKVKRGGKHDSP